MYGTPKRITTSTIHNEERITRSISTHTTVITHGGHPTTSSNRSIFTRFWNWIVCTSQYKSKENVDDVIAPLTRPSPLQLLQTSTTDQEHTPSTSAEPSSKWNFLNCNSSNTLAVKNDEHSIPTYNISSPTLKGEALIINNIQFEVNKERKGAELDEIRINKLLKKFGFETNMARNLRAREMTDVVLNFCQNVQHATEVSMVVIMTHGTNAHSNPHLTKVYGVDDQSLSVEHIINSFTSNGCRSLIDKPKIFIFQCCRGRNEYFTEKDAQVFRSTKNHKDVLIAYSTLPGFISNRNPTKGTWYIQKICEVFEKCGHQYDIESMFKIVNARLKNIDENAEQTSTYENRGFGRFYFKRP